MDENAPDHAIARILYEYQGHSIGQVYLCSAAHTQANTENISAGSQAPAAQTETGTAAPAETPEQKEIPDANARSKRTDTFLRFQKGISIPFSGDLLCSPDHCRRDPFSPSPFSQEGKKKICSCAVKRRLERLEDIGYSSSDFDQLLSQKKKFHSCLQKADTQSKAAP